MQIAFLSLLRFVRIDLGMSRSRGQKLVQLCTSSSRVEATPNPLCLLFRLISMSRCVANTGIVSEASVHDIPSFPASIITESFPHAKENDHRYLHAASSCSASALLTELGGEAHSLLCWGYGSVLSGSFPETTRSWSRSGTAVCLPCARRASLWTATTCFLGSRVRSSGFSTSRRLFRERSWRFLRFPRCLSCRRSRYR